LRPGDHLIASRWIYGGTLKLFDEEFSRFGIQVTYVDPPPRLWRKSVRKTTRAIFVERRSIRPVRVLDLAPLASLPGNRGGPLVDATLRAR
jgi:O-acetylhomoserine/O-acetylserine sulfhydrylase-like pyridoxal-dependent enzyme